MFEGVDGVTCTLRSSSTRREPQPRSKRTCSASSPRAGEEVAPHGGLFRDSLQPLVARGPLDSFRGGAERATTMSSCAVPPDLSSTTLNFHSRTTRDRPISSTCSAFAPANRHRRRWCRSFVPCVRRCDASSGPRQAASRSSMPTFSRQPCRSHANYPSPRGPWLSRSRRGIRAEWTVQKLTEIGINRIVPLVTERSVVRLDERMPPPRRAISPDAREAGSQSRRLGSGGRGSDDDGAFLLALEVAAGDVAIAEPGGGPVTATLDTILVGPEGGWSDQRARSCARPRRTRLGCPAGRNGGDRCRHAAHRFSISIAPMSGDSSALGVYVHVPFCAVRCRTTARSRCGPTRPI